MIHCPLISSRVVHSNTWRTTSCIMYRVTRHIRNEPIDRPYKKLYRWEAHGIGNVGHVMWRWKNTRFSCIGLECVEEKIYKADNCGTWCYNDIRRQSIGVRFRRLLCEEYFWEEDSSVSVLKNLYTILNILYFILSLHLVYGDILYFLAIT